jgi:hypothetical protein
MMMMIMGIKKEKWDSSVELCVKNKWMEETKQQRRASVCYKVDTVLICTETCN